MSLKKIALPALIIALANIGTFAVAADNTAAGWDAPQTGAKTPAKTTAKSTKASKPAAKPKAIASGTATQAGTSTDTSSATKTTTMSAVATTTGQSSGASGDPVATAKDTVSAWKEKHDQLWRGQ
jgi:hypothetical protein